MCKPEVDQRQTLEGVATGVQGLSFPRAFGSGRCLPSRAAKAGRSAAIGARAVTCIGDTVKALADEVSARATIAKSFIIRGECSGRMTNQSAELRKWEGAQSPFLGGGSGPPPPPRPPDSDRLHFGHTVTMTHESRHTRALRHANISRPLSSLHHINALWSQVAAELSLSTARAAPHARATHTHCCLARCINHKRGRRSSSGGALPRTLERAPPRPEGFLLCPLARALAHIDAQAAQKSRRLRPLSTHSAPPPQTLSDEMHAPVPRRQRRAATSSSHCGVRSPRALPEIAASTSSLLHT